VLIDTNILLYAVNQDAPQHEAARLLLAKRRAAGGFCVTWSVLYEFLRVATHPRVFASPLTPEVAFAVVAGLADDPRIDVLGEPPRHAAVLRGVLDDCPPLRGNRYHDAHIAATMREHGVTNIATADRHFRLFSFLSCHDPTRDGPG